MRVFLVFNISAFCCIQYWILFFFFVFSITLRVHIKLFHVIIIVAYSYISAAATDHVAYIVICVFICFISGIYIFICIKSLTSQKENHLSLRKSVKWHFTLKFVFRQIQEGRLLVRVICNYVCICVCVCIYAFGTNDFVNSQNLRFQKETSYQRSYLVHCNVLCKVIVQAYSHANHKSLWDSNDYMYPIYYIYIRETYDL
jgi:hypothetical protein